MTGAFAWPEVWLDELDELGPAPGGVPLPDCVLARTLLEEVGAPGDDIDEIVATMPAADDPEATAPGGRFWLLERAYHRLVAGLGTDDDFRPSPDGRGTWGIWPAPPTGAPPADRLFYVHLYLAALDGARAMYRSLGVPGAITKATFANLGRNIALHREKHGVSGLDAPWWFVLHMRGGLFHVGRLQYRRGRSWWADDALLGSEAPFGRKDPVLDLHVPPTGPLTPAAVDASVTAARRFFGAVLRGDDSAYGVCTSWLLDPQLREYLPEDANIIRFQERFRLVPGWEHDGDGSVTEFVFRRPADTPLDELPQRTTLERAVVAHRRAGRRWAVRRGWCRVG